MKKSCLVLLVALSLVLTVGCSKAGETLAELKADLQQEVAAPVPELKETSKEDKQKQLEIPDMDDLTIEETYEPVQTIGSSQGKTAEMITVNLYFADADGNSLVKTEKSIPKAEGMARATLEALLVGPVAAAGLQSALPEGTQLLDINIKGEEKLCIVDFSQELIAEAATEDISEELAIYSIANTLCQFPSVEQVEVRVEGETLTTCCFNSALVQ